MKTVLCLIAAPVLLAGSAFADIRSYHGGTRIGLSVGYGDWHGHHQHGRRNGHHLGGFYGASYGPLFTPAYFYDSSPYAFYSEPVTRTVVVRERTPETPVASTYAPSWTPGSGWKTHAWYRSSPEIVTPSASLQDARSADQLQQIYGSQAAGLSR